MKTRLLAALAAILLIATTPIAASPESIAAKLFRPTVQLTNMQGEGFCTGFVIDDETQFIMTAAHCIDPLSPYAAAGAFVDGQLAAITWYDSCWDASRTFQGENCLDAAVLQVNTIDLNRPALKPRTKPLKEGMWVMSAGFGWGLPNNQRRIGTLSNTNSHVWELGPGWLEFDFAVAGGNSGGPVVDDDGRVIAIVQLGDNDSVATWGRPISKIYEATKRFWRF